MENYTTEDLIKLAVEAIPYCDADEGLRDDKIYGFVVGAKKMIDILNSKNNKNE